MTYPYKIKDQHTIRSTYLMLKEKIKLDWVPIGTRPPNMLHLNYEHKFAKVSCQKV